MSWFRRRSVAPETRIEPAGPAIAPPRAEVPADARPRRHPVDEAMTVGRGELIDGVCGHRLAYPEAARRLIAWMQARGETGEITLWRLRLLYLRHCEDEGLASLPEQRLLNALVAEIGRDRKHERSVPRPDGVRRRVRTYDIPSPPPAAGVNPRSARVA
jgi:hypothetical protein